MLFSDQDQEALAPQRAEQALVQRSVGPNGQASSHHNSSQVCSAFIFEPLTTPLVFNAFYSIDSFFCVHFALLLRVCACSWFPGK
jgi:hypothetical protein